MDIRPATQDDKEAIGALLKESYNIATDDEGAEAFLHEMESGIHYIVAIEDSTIAGLASWIMHGLPKHGLIELDRIAVTSAFRGKGVAQQLTDGLIADAQSFLALKNSKLRKLYLLTHADNVRAQAFYSKIGLVHETTLKDHFYKDKDEWVMSKFFE